MKLKKLQLNKLKTKYSEKTLSAMDVAIKHIKKNKEIYNMLVVLLVLGFGDQVFIFLNDFVQNATIFGFGKNVSQEIVVLDGANKTVSSNRDGRIFGDDFNWQWMPLTPGENCVWMSEKGAYISAKTEKTDAEDFTLQGMPYFMGIVHLKKKLDIEKKMGERQILAFDKPNFSIMKVSINGKSIDGVGIAPYECDITDFVQDGGNLIEIELVSTARNFLTSSPILSS